MAGNDFLRSPGENSSPDYLPDPVFDDVFGLLANRRRRCLLHLLAHRDESRFWLTNLALELAEIEGRTPTTDSPSSDEFVIELHHNHLPLLADAGVLDYDPERKTGRYLGDSVLESVLEWEHAYTDAST